MVGTSDLLTGGGWMAARTEVMEGQMLHHRYWCHLCVCECECVCVCVCECV